MESKPNWGLWRYREDTPEGKYVVLRRDGTVFPGPNFVLGYRDRAAPAALRAYAAECQLLLEAGDDNYNEQYIQDCLRLADDMERATRNDPRPGDPGKGKHREDHPLVLEQMRNPGVAILAPRNRGGE